MVGAGGGKWRCDRCRESAIRVPITAIVVIREYNEMGKNSLIMPPKVLKSLINPFEERSKRYFFFKQCQVQLSFASPHKCTLLVLVSLCPFHLNIGKHSNTYPGTWINNPVMLGFNILWLTLLGGKERLYPSSCRAFHLCHENR